MEAKIDELNYNDELGNSIAGTTLFPNHLLTLINEEFIFMLLQKLQLNTSHVNDSHYIGEPRK